MHIFRKEGYHRSLRDQPVDLPMEKLLPLGERRAFLVTLRTRAVLIIGIRALIVGIGVLIMGIRVLIIGIRALIVGIRVLIIGIRALIVGIRVLIIGIRVLAKRRALL